MCLPDFSISIDQTDKKMISIKGLLDLGKMGFIPGPGENEGEFLKRVEVLKTLSQSSNKHFRKDECVSLNICSKVIEATLGWVPKTYSNYKLLPWEGAVLWSFKTPEGYSFPMIQLRKRFKKGYFLFYKLEKVIHHEAIHALRSVFDEMRFEEILAYSISKKKWRRILGPLFRKPKQTCTFILFAFISLVLQWMSIIFLNAFFTSLRTFSNVSLYTLFFPKIT